MGRPDYFMTGAEKTIIMVFRISRRRELLHSNGTPNEFLPTSLFSLTALAWMI